MTFPRRRTVWLAPCIAVALALLVPNCPAAGEQPATPASDTVAIPEGQATGPLIVDGTPPAPPTPAAEIVQMKLFVLSSMLYVHQDYGFVTWAIRSARPNLQDEQFGRHLEQIGTYLDQVASQAALVERLEGQTPAWTEVQASLRDLRQAVATFRQGYAKSAAGKPDPVLATSGELHEKVGKALPALFKKVGTPAAPAPDRKP
ncbi:MAG: hypothetical protein GX442_08330 [Candidatus Riflebacteria bacterium]|nr:hypothetical protein [Candidatus Riflebacteria bacterium]